MLRPVYLLVARRPLTKTGSSGSHYHRQPSSINASHKLNTLTVQKEVDKSESDSTHQLAGTTVRDGSISSNSDYNEPRNENAHGNCTIIVGSAEEGSKIPGDEAGPPEGGAWPNMGGIVVTNETSVRISRVN